MFKTKLNLNSPLSESDRRGFQVQFCWIQICHRSLRADRRVGHAGGRVRAGGGQADLPRPAGRGGANHKAAGSSAKECKSVDMH